jgi:hypothetical protein
MQCKFCLFHNSGDEERCQRCSKHLSGDVTFDGFSVAGATALVPRRISSVADTGGGGAATAVRMARETVATARQTSLFTGEPSSNVIPFASLQRPAADSFQRHAGRAAAAPFSVSVSTEVPRNLTPGRANKPVTEVTETITKQATKKQSTGRRTSGIHMSETQGSLDLEFLPPAPQVSRTLKTTVEASIYCDAEVAAPMHRSVATILDAAMILIASGIFVGIFQGAVQYFGGSVAFDKFDLIIFGCSAVLITMFYGFLFALAGRETAGQHWTELRLINFDGFPPDGLSRGLRFAGGWLSFCACGIGLLWSLLDEENLTWHDHMSKTFLTMREGDLPFFRERK